MAVPTWRKHSAFNCPVGWALTVPGTGGLGRGPAARHGEPALRRHGGDEKLPRAGFRVAADVELSLGPEAAFGPLVTEQCSRGLAGVRREAAAEPEVSRWGLCCCTRGAGWEVH